MDLEGGVMRKQTRVWSKVTVFAVALVAGISISTPLAANAAIATTRGFSVTTVAAFNAPKAIAVTPDGKALYVANSGNQTVSVIDTATNHILRTISDPGFSTPTGLAITPDGKAIYVSNHGSGTVSKVRTSTDKVVATIGTINTNAHPTGVAITPDGTKAFVTEGGLDVVTVINLATDAVTGTISVGSDPEGIAISPDGTKALVTNHGDLLHPGSSISVINVATRAVSVMITDPSRLHSPLGIVFAPDGLTAYAANRGQITSPGNSVAVIDVATNTVTAAVRVANYPMSVAVTPDGSKVYVSTDVDSGAVSVIDADTEAVSSVDTSDHPLGYMTGIASAPNGDTVYLAAQPGRDTHTGLFPESGYGYTVAVLDTDSDTVSGLVPTVGTTPVSVALSPDDQTAYVLGRGTVSSAVVSVIDTATDVATKGIFLPSGNSLATSPDGHWVYVTAGPSTGSGSVTVIDTGTESVAGSIPVGTNPQGLAFAPDSSKAYVANLGDGTVSVIDTATKTAVNTINVQPSSAFTGDAEGVTVSHDGTRVYVSNGAIINAVSGNVSGPLSYDTEQRQGIALSLNGKTAYAVQGDGAVRVVNTATGTLTTFILGDPLGDKDWLTSVQLSPNGTTGYFLDQRHDTMLAVNLSSHAVTGTVNVGDVPTGLATSADGRAVYVANGTSSSVSAITLPPHLTSTPIPKIVGMARVGHKLAVRPGTWAPAKVTLRYHWYAGGKAIAEATKTTLKLTKNQKGKRITVKVTGSKPGYASVTKTSKPTAKVRK
jgi:YVTN family beta-propeller protein